MSAVAATNVKYRDEYCCVPQSNGNPRIHNELSFHHILSEKKFALRKQWIIAIRRDEGPFFQSTMKRYVSETKQRSPSLKHSRNITTGALGFWKKLDKIKLSKKDVFVVTCDDEFRHATTDSGSLPSSTSSYEMLEEDLDDAFEVLDNEDSDIRIWSEKVNAMIKVRFGERIRVLVARIDQRLRDFREVSSRRLAAFSLGKPVGTIHKEESSS